MKRNAFRSVFVGLFLLSPGLSWASGPGTTGANVLNIPVGARAVGMGEAYVAQADDVSSLYWNPAGLALMQERQASFMYSPMIQDMSYQNAAIGIPLDNAAIGGSLSYLSYGQIAGYANDNVGTPIGNQSAYSGVATLGAAWLGNQWSAGANLKGIQDKLADVSANDYAVDLGADLIYPKPVLGGTVRFGAVLQNLGPGEKFLQQTDPLPREWKIGVAAVQMMDKRLNVSMDYGSPLDDNATISGGAEYWINRFLALRAGYVNNSIEGSGIRAGVGLKIRGISFDYAYQNQGELGMTHRYELTMRFGTPRPILSAEENKIFQQAKADMRQNRYEQAVLLLDSVIELEPNYKPARRYINMAMAKLEGQQSQMIVKRGQAFEPSADSGTKKPALPEMDDLEQLLNLGTPHAAEKSSGNPTAPTKLEDRMQ